MQCCNQGAGYSGAVHQSSSTGHHHHQRVPPPHVGRTLRCSLGHHWLSAHREPRHCLPRSKTHGPRALGRRGVTEGDSRDCGQFPSDGPARTAERTSGRHNPHYTQPGLPSGTVDRDHDCPTKPTKPLQFQPIASDGGGSNDVWPTSLRELESSHYPVLANVRIVCKQRRLLTI